MTRARISFMSQCDCTHLQWFVNAEVTSAVCVIDLVQSAALTILTHGHPESGPHA